MTLEVRGLNKVFVPTAAGTGAGIGIGIHDVSFALPPGTFFTLLGPSGCGKTTTLRSVAGLQEPDTGFIGVGGDVLFDSGRGISVPLNERGIGMVFQSYAIWPHMTVAENISFPLRVGKGRRPPRAEVERKVAAALAAVALSEQADRPATRLSGGQQQRVALARAIVAEPKLLLLDEPLSNLDAALRDRTRAELKRLQQQLGVTTVYVTHDQTEALEMSDEIAVMHAGRIVQRGSPREIYGRPANRFVATFIGSTNLLEGRAVDRAPADAVGAVRLEDGAVLRALFPQERGKCEALGLSVRPEDIAIEPAGAAAAGEDNVLAGTVVASTFSGSLNRCQVRCGELVLQANARPQRNVSVGDAVSLRFPARSACVVAN